MSRNSIKLCRRGFSFGDVEVSSDGVVQCLTQQTDETALSNWQQGKPIVLKRICRDQLAKYSADLRQSELLYHSVIDEQECDHLLTESPYQSRIEQHFDPLGSAFNEGDDQEIETVCFDAIENGKTLAEDLWIKISWLSFHDHDASIRFRFSFGIDHEEDVAADKIRQLYAANLTEAVFPESKLVTENRHLAETLSQILKCDSVNFVERIIYFNAPQGGAYLHHDRERGHAGVVYAQVSGRTIWLALPKSELQKQIVTFIRQCQTSNQWPPNIDLDLQTELIKLCSEQNSLSDAMESFCHTGLIHLMNETQKFVQHLISQGHARLIEPGDIILLPQQSETNCCWHSVFCADNNPGQALSFAIRGNH